MKVDAYTATVPDGDPSEIMSWLLDSLPVREQLQLGKENGIASWKYEHARGVFDGKSAVAAVRWGGNGGGVSIELKGSVSDDVYSQLRKRYSDHSCTRMDVAIDQSSPGLFACAYRRLKTIAADRPQQRRVAIEKRGDWVYREKGRSAYFGSTDSDVQAVLYEKGLERVAKGAIELCRVDRNWARLELRMHPKKSAHKKILSTLQPVEAWGWTEWTSRFLESFTGFASDKVTLPIRPKDDDRAWGAMLHQYGGLLQRRTDGDFEELGRLIAHDLASMAALKRGTLKAA